MEFYCRTFWSKRGLHFARLHMHCDNRSRRQGCLRFSMYRCVPYRKGCWRWFHSYVKSLAFVLLTLGRRRVVQKNIQLVELVEEFATFVSETEFELYSRLGPEHAFTRFFSKWGPSWALSTGFMRSVEVNAWPNVRPCLNFKLRSDSRKWVILRSSSKCIRSFDWGPLFAHGRYANQTCLSQTWPYTWRSFG